MTRVWKHYKEKENSKVRAHIRKMERIVSEMEKTKKDVEEINILLRRMLKEAEESLKSP